MRAIRLLVHRCRADEDLVALGIPFSEPEYLDKSIQALRADGAEAERALRLLERYVPIGPKDPSADQWNEWWKANKPYAFASDSGDYRWYIDPLAKKRGIPASELRGPKRADGSARSN